MLQGGSRRSLDSHGQQTDSRRSMNLTEANVEKGMVLPFEPMIMTFKDVHYFVDLPSVCHRVSGELQIRLTTLSCEPIYWVVGD